MLQQSSEMVKLIEPSDLKTRLQAPLGDVELYLGKTADFFENMGFLNIVVRKYDEEILFLPISEFLKTKIIVKHLPRLINPNASMIMSISMDDKWIYAQHWDGFRSSFDAKDMNLVSQEYTK